jgi:Zn-dependent peptidase ImmA (M78 family)
MISQRIRQARVAAGMSQDEVVAALSTQGVTLTKAAVSKYERGGSVPRASLLKHLGVALGVAPEYFLRETSVTIDWLAFRKRATAGIREQERFQAMAQECVEAQLELRDALRIECESRFPEKRMVETPDEAENAAEALRREWELDDLPVESMVELIEDRDGIVVEIEGAEKAVDGMAGLANGCHAIVVIDPGLSDDRKRFTLAHELGHLCMNTSGVASWKSEERLAHRFASAFLVPAAIARRELGTRRSHLSFEELMLLKQKHGLSMQAWLYRALDCGIIDQSHMNAMFERLGRKGWRCQEPVEYRGHEKPMRFRQMAFRAVAEGLLSSEKARKWIPDLGQELGTATSGSMTASKLRKLPYEQRSSILMAAAESAAAVYGNDPALQQFEVYDDMEDAL